jgi:transposase
MTVARQDRDGNGKYTRDLAVAERDATAARLRTQGLSYRAIGEALGIDPSMAYRGVQRVLAETVQEAGAEMRKIELERLDEAWQRVQALAGSSDDDVALKAEAMLLKIQERRAKLLGLDSPTKVDVSTGLRYEISGVDMASCT